MNNYNQKVNFVQKKSQKKSFRSLLNYLNNSIIKNQDEKEYDKFIPVLN